jgi:hypothetical protein
MKKKTTISISISILIAISSAISSILVFPGGDNVLEQSIQKVSAQQPSNYSAISVNEITNTTAVGEKIIHRGIVISWRPTHFKLNPGEDFHGVSILPHRQDGATYEGVLTFTATKPVDVGFGHRIHIDNSTLSQLDTKTFGDLEERLHINEGAGGGIGVSGIISVPSVIVPDYGNTVPYFSASIPFVASSVWLRSPSGEPFIAVYEVAAQIDQPRAVVHIGSAISGGNSTAAAD